jgi:hypothetical protein
MAHDTTAIVERLNTLVRLKRERQTLTADLDEQIAALELEKTKRTVGIDTRIARLEADVKLEILTHGQTVKIPGLTASYSLRRSWDSDGLLTFADEVPAIKQFLSMTGVVSLRYSR